MITIRAFVHALSVASAGKTRIRKEHEREQRVAAATKQARVAAQEDEWRAERQRREEAALDADGSRAAARAAREEQLEEERLAFMAAQIARRT